MQKESPKGHVLRAEEPVLRYLLRHLHSHTLKVSYMWTASHACIITECIMVRACTAKNKLYNIFLSIKAVNQKRDTSFTCTPISYPASTLNCNPSRESRPSASSFRSASICRSIFHFQLMYLLFAMSVSFVQIFAQFSKNLEHSQPKGAQNPPPPHPGPYQCCFGYYGSVVYLEVRYCDVSSFALFAQYFALLRVFCASI